MPDRETHQDAGDELVKQDLITREDLEAAREHEARSGTPWYRQLIAARKISFGAIEDVLRYEFHPKAVRAEHQQLGDTLVAMGVLTPDRLREALTEQRRSGRLLGSVLLERGFASRDSIAQALSRQYGLEFSPIAQTPSERSALEKVPEYLARKNEFLPISIEGDRLTVLVTSPQMREKLNDVAVLLGVRLHVVLTASDDFAAAIRKRYATLSEGQPNPELVSTGRRRQITRVGPVSEAPVAAPASMPAEPLPAPLEQQVKNEQETKAVAISESETSTRSRFEDIARAASGAPVIKLVSTILEGAVNSAATDIHLDPQDPEMRVRYRIDGVLHDVMSIPHSIESAVVSRVKIMADLDITETRHPQDGHISMEVGGREFDVRVATLPTYLGERLVMRLLDQSAILAGIKDLGMEPEDEEAMFRIIDQPYGMILVTGPTGSGKTTTLYASLNQKNVMTDSIVTLEDPVEYQLSGINQVQVDPDIGLTFAATLRAAMRQDIDVLLVGEIRDAETAQIAVRAAMTGHLVFSTLHTNDALEAISTLRNMGVPAFLISSALTAVIGQRLVRKICENCRASYKPAAGLLKSVGLTAATKKLYKGKGCDACYQTGNRGRTGIFEVLEISPELRKLISAEAPIETIAEAAKLKSLAERCRAKVKRGEVEPEEYLRVIRG